MKKSEKKLWECLGEIFEIREEIASYAILFTSFRDMETEAQDFYGVGLAMRRLSRKLEKVHRQMDRSMVQVL